MTTPTGLAMWGQAGAYNGVDDRAVIRAVTGGRTGMANVPSVVAASGLNLTLKAGWLGVADCGDGTSLVVGSRTDQTIAGLAGPPTGTRTDYLWCDIQPDSATWTLSVINATAAAGRTGLAIATLTVPANATLASQFTITAASALLERRLLWHGTTNDSNTRTATSWTAAVTLISATATCLPGHWYRVRLRADAFMPLSSSALAARAGIGYRAQGAADSTSALYRSSAKQCPAANYFTAIEAEYTFMHPIASAAVARNFDGRWWVGGGSYKVSGATDGGACISMSVEDMGL